MRLEIASKKAVQYACLNFHYSKVVPAQYLGYSVFNNNNEWTEEQRREFVIKDNVGLVS